METNIYKERLLEEKKILEEELSGLGKVDGEGNWQAAPEHEMNVQEVQDEADLSERAEDFEERASKLIVLKARLEDVDKSLAQIESNDFGKCKSCGKEIGEDRLEANPAAHTCKSCIDK